MGIAPSILNVYPAPDAKGIVLSDRIKVWFDREMDEVSISTGTFVLLGPNESFIFGPDFNPLDKPGIEDEGLLTPPYYSSFVKGSIEFKRVDEDGEEVDVKDYEGDGTLYRTLAIFTPEKPLAPGIKYSFVVAGDEDPDDDFDTGVKTRTVFDTEKVVAAGTGDLVFKGGFNFSVPRTYWVEITTGGPTGQAKYIWWEEIDPLNTTLGVTTTGRRFLEHGVWIECDADGVFEVGDQFKVVCIPCVVLENNYKWTFETGSGSIMEPPSDASTTGITEVASVDTDLPEEALFAVTSIVPGLRDYDIDPGLAEIVITFSHEPNPDTVVVDNFSVITEPVNGGPLPPAQGQISFSLFQENNIVTLKLDPDQLQPNNLIQVHVENIQDLLYDKTLAPFTSFFTTTYNPAYTSIRRIRLELGPLITEIPNETVMLAIYEASLFVDSNSFVKTTTNAEYLAFAKRELATCLASLFLLNGTLGSTLGHPMTKKLADLEVSRGKGDFDRKAKMDELQQCIALWKIPVQTGASSSTDTSPRPQYSVKGSTAEDAIGVGREWQPTSGIGIADGFPAGNSYSRATSRRWVRTYRKRR